MFQLPDLPELSPTEKAMPLSKYYLPMDAPSPLRLQLIEAGPLNSSDVPDAEHFLSMLRLPGEYDEHEFGYCMMPDGSGYIALYQRSDPRITGEMTRWYLQWMNFRPKSSAAGEGNLRYKLWMPLDHIDHQYVNGKDNRDGIYTLETLDLGAGEKPVGSVHHRVDPRELVPQEQLDALEAAGCSLRIAVESFDESGSHFCVTLTRPCPLGQTESLSREWIGWRLVNGKLVRDPKTPVTEGYLRNVAIHNTMEAEHLPKFLPALYEEYRDQPPDTD